MAPAGQEASVHQQKAFSAPVYGYGYTSNPYAGGQGYAGLGYGGHGYAAGLRYAGLGHPGLGYAGLGYGGLGYPGLGLGFRHFAGARYGKREAEAQVLASPYTAAPGYGAGIIVG